MLEKCRIKQKIRTFSFSITEAFLRVSGKPIRWTRSSIWDWIGWAKGTSTPCREFSLGVRRVGEMNITALLWVVIALNAAQQAKDERSWLLFDFRDACVSNPNAAGTDSKMTSSLTFFSSVNKYSLAKCKHLNQLFEMMLPLNANCWKQNSVFTLHLLSRRPWIHVHWICCS